MIMIDTKGPINSPSDGNYIFVIVDAFSQLCVHQKIMPTMHTQHYSNIDS